MDKQALIKRIAETEDEALLERIKQLMDFAQDESDFWDGLSDIEKEDIKAGLNDLEEGRHKPLDDVLRKYL